MGQEAQGTIRTVQSSHIVNVEDKNVCFFCENLLKVQSFVKRVQRLKVQSNLFAL